jgi:hypothetical protein
VKISKKRKTKEYHREPKRGDAKKVLRVERMVKTPSAIY